MFYPGEKYLDKRFNEEFRRGAVVHFRKYPFEDGDPQNKYLIILNCNFEQNVFFFLTTSQIKPHHFSRQFEYYIIKAGEFPFFKKNTAIKIFDRKPLPRQLFRDGFSPHEEKPIIQIVGYLPAEHMEKIDDLIEKSPNIPIRIKEIILGDDHKNDN